MRREDGSGSASAGKKSEGRGLFATVVSSAAAKGKRLSLVKGRTARVSATESTAPLTQQSTLSTALTVRCCLFMQRQSSGKMEGCRPVMASRDKACTHQGWCHAPVSMSHRWRVTFRGFPARHST